MNTQTNSKYALIYITISKKLLREISVPLAIIFLRTYDIVNISSLFPSCVQERFPSREEIKDFRAKTNQSIHRSVKLIGDFQNFALFHLRCGNLKSLDCCVANSVAH